MEQIKIQDKFWDKIVSRKKIYLFAELSKGLETGIYELVSVENKSNEYCMHCIGFPSYVRGTNIFITDENHDDVVNCKRTPKKVYGTVKLEPMMINPTFDEFGFTCSQCFYNNRKNRYIDEETRKFVKENYIDKNIDFVCYEILEVKEVKNG